LRFQKVDAGRIPVKHRAVPGNHFRLRLTAANDLLDDQGRLKSPELLQRLRKQVEGFVEFVERLRGRKLREAL
jgi:hypothetical protein